MMVILSLRGGQWGFEKSKALFKIVALCLLRMWDLTHDIPLEIQSIQNSPLHVGSLLIGLLSREEAEGRGLAGGISD